MPVRRRRHARRRPAQKAGIAAGAIGLALVVAVSVGLAATSNDSSTRESVVFTP